jgi:hypothetical protein
MFLLCKTLTLLIARVGAHRACGHTICRITAPIAADDFGRLTATLCCSRTGYPWNGIGAPRLVALVKAGTLTRLAAPADATTAAELRPVFDETAGGAVAQAAKGV